MRSISAESQLIIVLVLGTLCQLVGWRLRIPSILLLLCAGIILGPIAGLVWPDYVFGPSLMPLVEVAVAVILFEGGLSLKKAEMGTVGPIVLRLISIAAFVTWGLLTFLGTLLLPLGVQTAALLGAILVVSGPTVVIPLLRTLRARAPVEPILRWEGIVIDPVGVLLAVLVAEVCEAGVDASAPGRIVIGMIVSLGVGGTLGWIGARLLRITVGQHRFPDQFIVPFALAVLFALVTLSNLIHEQSGLLTSTIMGLVVARSKGPWVQTIEDFLGHTQRMFIGMLFIVLAARLDPLYVRYIDLNLIVFIGAAILVVRPVAVFFATVGSGLSLRERGAIASLAPRGIVSAALASSLGASLAGSSLPGVENLVPYTFAIIIGSVVVYGVCSPLVFRLLGAQQSPSQGVLFVGAHRFALALGKLLVIENFKVAFVDTNPANIRRARNQKFDAYEGSILSDGVQDLISFEGIGNLIALTPNEEANSLATVEFSHIFESSRVFQFSPVQGSVSRKGGRIFGHVDLTYEKMEELWSRGYRPVCREVSGDHAVSAPKNQGGDQYVLFEISGARLRVVSADGFKPAVKVTKRILFVPEAEARSSN